MAAEVERRPSALIAQYLRIKAQHKAAILLFRLGDFYEMFFEDAETAAPVLDLTLTARNRGDPDEVPLCGFPAHAAQPYVARLLAAGQPVAICEQTEARGGGLLEREVVRVVTPGTILEEESLDPAAPSLLAALATDGARYGLAAIDFATGAFRATEVESWDAAREELERLAPRELLLAGDLPDDVGAACRADRPWATAALPEPAALDGLAGRVGARTAGPRDLAHLAVALDRVADVRTALGAARAEAFATITAALDALPDVSAEIVRTLVDAPPPHTRLPGFIRAGCSTEVDALRDAARDGKGWLARFEAAERARTGITSLKVRHNRVFGYYVEVTRPNLALVPLDYERKQTLVGAERFVTPALKEHEARVLGAEERLRGLEAHLFEALLDTVALHQPSLARTAGAPARVDALAALGEVAHRRAYVRPRISEAPVLRIRGGRHPVVEAVAGTRFVPNDTTLDPDSEQVLVVTGPNMGGKSTYLRQVALIALLAQMGSFVPATEAEVGLADRLFTRVGASDNLVGGESTFMVEMRETAYILANLTPRSVVVLDEIGRGTSTFDGISIAWAVAEHLHDTAERPRTLFATHYHELTALAAEHPRVRNVSVAVAEWKGEIVFLRQIVPGPASRSYGVEVARLAGVPPAVVARARALLAELEAGEGPASRQPHAATPQLSLFAAPEAHLRRELATIDPERLTPLEALAVLARFVDAARQGG